MQLVLQKLKEFRRQFCHTFVKRTEESKRKTSENERADGMPTSQAAAVPVTLSAAVSTHWLPLIPGYSCRRRTLRYSYFLGSLTLAGSALRFFSSASWSPLPRLPEVLNSFSLGCPSAVIGHMLDSAQPTTSLSFRLNKPLYVGAEMNPFILDKRKNTHEQMWLSHFQVQSNTLPTL